MSSLFKMHLFILYLICTSAFSFSQSNEIKIRFIGNCGLHITDGNSNFYIDFPYKSGAHNYMEYDKSELDSLRANGIFIFTHDHADHYSKPGLKNVTGEVFGPWNVEKLQQINSSIPSFSIQPFKTKHRFSFNHYSYLISFHGKRIFISGDTEHAETIGTLTALDWAFVPAWLVRDAKEKKIKINAEIIGVYHIGPGDKITSDNPKIHLFDKQGEIISIPY